MKRLICALLCLIMIVPVVACSRTEDSPKRGGTHESVIKETDKMFVSNRSSDYVLLIPDESLNAEHAAAREIRDFMELSTGYKLPIVSESGLNTDKYVSIGQTKKLKASGITVDTNSLKNSGYRIQTQGDAVYIFGGDNNIGYGTRYGAYGFLEHMIGYKYYADTEIKYEKKPNLAFLDMQVTAIPDFDYRNTRYLSTWEDKDYTFRMRFTPDNMVQAVRGHTDFQIISPEVYKDYPEWFNTTKTQLDFTNEAMQAEYIKRVKQILDDEPDATELYMTMEDNSDECRSAASIAAKELYKTYSGVQMVFRNKVINEVEEWIKVKYPKRIMKYVTYAYYATYQPPAVWNETSKKYEYHPDVVPHDKLEIKIINLDIDRTKSITHSDNAEHYKVLQAWGAISDNLSIALYEVNYHSYFLSINNFETIESSYKAYVENGVTALLQQGAYQVSNVASMYEMKAYINSQLMWNTNQKYDDLVNEFLGQYFREASGTMREYYDLYRTWITVLENEMNYTYITPYNSRYWPKNMVDQFDNLIAKAITNIEKYKDIDEELYANLYDKIKKERMMSLFLYLRFYQSYFTKVQLNEMIDELEYYAHKNKILYSQELITLQPIIDGWRAANK